jgi:2-(1,2-epoxy-1,2-dihydrophenyl)acetyl-CoA isomerase
VIVELTLETLRLSIVDGIGRLTLANPDKGNPLGSVFGRELLEAAVALEGAPGLRSVLMCAQGRNFCVGGNLGEFAGQMDLGGAVRKMTADYHAALSTMLRLQAPIVTAVQGASAGAGVALGALGDIVVAGAGSTFTFAYTAIGFSPDGASTWLLPRLIGLRRFQELILTNRRIDAEEAARIGLVTEVVPDESLMERAEGLVMQLGAGPTGAYAAVRALALSTFSNVLEAQLEAESRLLSEQCRTKDVAEGIAAILQKRPAAFQGQ